jgi:hypothetical protein
MAQPCLGVRRASRPKSTSDVERHPIADRAGAFGQAPPAGIHLLPQPGNEIASGGQMLAANALATLAAS